MRIFRDKRGQSTIFVALFMGIVMLGFIAFALDVGYLFEKKRMAQAAADAAALAAAEEGSTTTNGINAANVAATLNGFNTSLATNPATVTLSTLSSGNYSSTAPAPPASWVQAVVSQPIHTFFLGAFNNSMKTVTVSASSVTATGQNVSDCLCLEGTTGTDLAMSNGSSFTGSSCAVRENSTSSSAITVVGGSVLCSQAIGTAVAWNDASNGPNVYNGGSVCGTAKLVSGLSACAPTMPNVPVDVTCSANPVTGSNTSYTVGPGSSYGTTLSSANGNMVCYNGLIVNGNSNTVTLNSGIYIINGTGGLGLHFESGGPNPGGNGVLFYLENGAMLTIDSGANVNLVAGGNTMSGGGTALSTGIYNGILFYQDPGYPAAANDGTSDTGDSAAVTIAGGATVFINGEIVAPLAVATLNNGSGTTIKASMVVKSLTMAGAGTLTNSTSTNLGNVSLAGVADMAQ